MGSPGLPTGLHPRGTGRAAAGGCPMTSAMIEQEVLSLLEGYADAVRRRDRTAILAMFTDDAVVIGTGTDEWYRGRADLARGLDRDLGQATDLSVTYGTPEVGGEGD